jgi:hypothetical protein
MKNRPFISNSSSISNTNRASDNTKKYKFVKIFPINEEGKNNSIVLKRSNIVNNGGFRG